jgi:hypothetical protein
VIRLTRFALATGVMAQHRGMAEHFARTVRGSGPGILLAHGAGGSAEGNVGPLLDDLAATRSLLARVG